LRVSIDNCLPGGAPFLGLKAIVLISIVNTDNVSGVKTGAVAIVGGISGSAKLFAVLLEACCSLSLGKLIVAITVTSLEHFMISALGRWLGYWLCVITID
jgi:hypothetical protein